MKIAVNTRLLLKDKLDGIGLFTLETFKELVATHPEVEFIFIFDRNPHPDFVFAKNIVAKVIHPQARHPWLFKIWYQFSLKRFLNRKKPDIFIATDGMIPLNCKVKTLAVIHDLCFEHYPEHIPTLYRNYFQKYYPKFAKQATRIATVSEFSKLDIHKTYHIETHKIDVVYNGSNSSFKPLSLAEQNKIKSEYTDGHDFFLFIGTLHPRKNLINLFVAFDNFKSESKSPLKLLIVGRKMWWTKEMEDTLNNLTHKTEIIFTDRITEDKLVKITASAYTLTYIPLFEGFGIPLVEAMSCGVPVITSNVTSMPEVTENAGILINPNSTKEITEALLKVTSDVEFRNSLSIKSLEQAKKFSWKKTSDLLWSSIQKTIHA